MPLLKPMLRQCKIMLAWFIIVAECINDHLQVFGIAQKIRIASVYDECFDIVLFDVLSISLLYVEQVLVGDRLFIGPVTLADVLLQFAYRRVQVDKNIRLCQLLVNDLEQLLVESEFFIR